MRKEELGYIVARSVFDTVFGMDVMRSICWCIGCGTEAKKS